MHFKFFGLHASQYGTAGIVIMYGNVTSLEHRALIENHDTFLNGFRDENNRTCCKHSVADAVFNSHPCAVHTVDGRNLTRLSNKVTP